MKRHWNLLVGALLLGSPLVLDAAAAEPKRVGIFDVELVDTSLNGDRDTPAENKRLADTREMLSGYFEGSPDYAVIDDASMREKGRAQNLQSCGGCDVSLAKAAGADLAVTAVVQKVSNLILSITIYVRSTETGEIVQMAGTDIRGNTDESWARGVKWLAKNRLHLIN